MTASSAGLVRGVSSGLSCGWLAPAAEMAATVTGWWPAAREFGATLPRLPRVATRSPELGTDSLHAARVFTSLTLGRWGVSCRGDDIAMVVTELLTNAIRHGLAGARAWRRGDIRLGLLQPGPCVLCAVADPSGAMPAPREAGLFEETGRGLGVVATLSDQWGFTAPGAAGKVVWAVFATGGGAGASQARPRREDAAASWR